MVVLEKLFQTFFFSPYRYWNDPETLQKIGEAMGAGFPFGPGPSAEPSATEEAEEEAEEDESIVHNTASVGDHAVMELWFELDFYHELF
jgi:hypothetical protein